MCGAAWAASTTTIEPTAWAASISCFNGVIVPSALVGLGGLLPQRVDAAVRVRVVEAVEARFGLDHLDRLLGGCTRVEVDERFAVEGALEDREVAPDRFHVERAHLMQPLRPVL